MNTGALARRPLLASRPGVDAHVDLPAALEFGPLYPDLLQAVFGEDG